MSRKLPILDGRPWLGKGKYYGTRFLVLLRESKRHPGYYHFMSFCYADGEHYTESGKPFKVDSPEELKIVLDVSLREHGLQATDLRWGLVPKTAHHLLSLTRTDGD